MSPRPLLRSLATGHTARRIILLLALLIVVLAVISLVLLSPFALAALDPDSSADWERLGNISQTYAAASAVLALLALGGVAVSLVLQAREMRLARQQALRMFHVELLKMAMDNPLYMRSWGPFISSEEQDQRQQHMYVNLIISYWSMLYEIGELSDVLLRAEATNLFQGDVGQRFWRNGRDYRMRTTTGRRPRRFVEILDEEYQKTIQPSPPPPAPPAEPEPEPETPESPQREESGQEPPEPSP